MFRALVKLVPHWPMITHAPSIDWSVVGRDMSGGGGNETRVYQLFYRDDDMKVEEQGGGRDKARVYQLFYRDGDQRLMKQGEGRGKARVSSRSKGKYVRYLSP